MHALALNGTVWNIAAYSVAQLVRLASSVILTHLLVPQYFGLMTLLNAVIIGLNLFSDLGIGANIVRSARGDDPLFLKTAWTLQVLRGCGLWIAALFLAYPLSRFYGQPELFKLLPIVALVLVISGFESTKVGTLYRHLQVPRLASLEVGVQVFQLIVTAAWAMVQPSLWALVGGRLCSELMKLVLSYRLNSAHQDGFAWDRDAVKSLIHFGKWIFVSTALTFVASQSDRLVLGKFLSLSTLGLYGVAFALADIPRQVILSFCGRVAFPFISKFAGLDRGRFRNLTLKYRAYVLVFSGALLAIIANSADLALIRLYDKRYHEAAWIVPILALGLWHTLLYSTISPALLAIGQSRFNALGQFLSALVLLGLTPVTFYFGGLWGAIWLISFSDLPMYLVNLYGARREKLGCLEQDAKFTVLYVAMLMCAGLIRLLMGIPYQRVTVLR